MKKLSFHNALIRAYNNADRVEECFAQLEQQLDNIHDANELQNFLVAFPRGGILGVMLDKPDHIVRRKGYRIFVETARCSIR